MMSTSKHKTQPAASWLTIARWLDLTKRRISSKREYGMESRWQKLACFMARYPSTACCNKPHSSRDHFPLRWTSVLVSTSLNLQQPIMHSLKLGQGTRSCKEHCWGYKVCRCRRETLPYSGWSESIFHKAKPGSVLPVPACSWYATQLLPNVFPFFPLCFHQFRQPVCFFLSPSTLENSNWVKSRTGQ